MREIVTAFGAVLAFLIPLGIYCLILASINRRSQPMIVSGVWDSLGLMFAVSGFLFITLPMLFSEFCLRTLDVPIAEHLFGTWLRYAILWGVYLLLLGSGGALMVLWRAHKTIIYNVDCDLFPKFLERTLAVVGLAMTVERRRLVLTRVENADSTAIMEATPRPDEPPFAELAVESFPSMCNVTLHWDKYVPEVRQQVEQELGKHLITAAPLDNAAAGWFLSVSGLLSGAIVMIAMAVIYLVVFTRRWE